MIDTNGTLEVCAIAFLLPPCPPLFFSFHHLLNPSAVLVYFLFPSNSLVFSRSPHPPTPPLALPPSLPLFRPSLPPYLPTYLPTSLPPSLPPYLPPTLPPSLPPSPPSLCLFRSFSRSRSLARALPPSRVHARPPPSLPPVLPPSLPPSLPRALSLSLSPSIPIPLLSLFTIRSPSLTLLTPHLCPRLCFSFYFAGVERFATWCRCT